MWLLCSVLLQALISCKGQCWSSFASPQVEGLHVVGVDPNPYMFEYARERARAAGLPEDALDLAIGVAEKLPFSDASFDSVICTLVRDCFQGAAKAPFLGQMPFPAPELLPLRVYVSKFEEFCMRTSA